MTSVSYTHLDVYKRQAYVVVNAVYLAIALVVVGSGVYRGGNPNIAMISLIKLR